SLVKEHRAAGVKLLPAPAREGLSGLEAPQFTTDIFSRKLGTAGEKILKTSPPYQVNQPPVLSQCFALSLYNGQTSAVC
ncbi:MAG: hypothetical protein ACLT0Y_01700, partial [Christensenellales bacterium]